ncbi:MAG: translocation/assembly module TamB domain-containing protein [Kofleriaceae bacterium]
MRRALRWTKRIGLGLVAFVVVVIGVALLIIHTNWGREQIREQAQGSLQELFPGAKIGSIEGSVFGELVVRDLELRRADGSLTIKVGTVRAELAVGALFHQTARVERLVAEDVEVIVDPALMQPEPEEPPSDSGWTVELPNIEVVRAKVAIHGAEPTDLDDVAVTGAVEVPPEGAIRIDSTVTGTWRQRATPFKVVGQLAIGDNLQIPQLVVTAEGISIVANDVDLDQPSGHASVTASAAALAALVPGTSVPGDLKLDAQVKPDRGQTRVDVSGSAGRATIYVGVLGDIVKRQASGLISVAGLELPLVTEGKIPGTAGAVVAFSIDEQAVRGTVFAQRAAPEEPARSAIVSFNGRRDAAGSHATLLVGGTGDDGLGLSGTVALSRIGSTTHVKSNLRVSSAKAEIAPFAQLAGSLQVEATQHGTLIPFSPHIEAKLAGTNLRFDDLAIGSLRGTVAVQPDLSINGHAEIDAITRGGDPVGRASLDARSRPDGAIAVSLNARPTAIAGRIDADAVVTMGEPLRIALGNVAIRPDAGAAWEGHGGSVTIDARRIAIDGIRLASGTASAHIEANIDRVTQVLDAKVAANGIPATLIDPAFRGTASATASIERRGDRWNGTAEVSAAGFATAADAPAFDANARIGIAGQRVTIAATGSNAKFGAAKLALEVDGPRDLTDPVAWRALPRKQLRALEVELERIELAAISDGAIAGTVRGKLAIRDGIPSGTLYATNVAGVMGDVNAELSLRGTPGEVTVTGVAKLEPFGGAEITAVASVPDRPFDPASWRRGAKALLREANVRVADITLDAPQWGRLCTLVPASCPAAAYRARVALTATLSEAASKLAVSAQLRDVRGGRLIEPVSAGIEAIIDGTSTRAKLLVGSKQGTLLSAEASMPISLDRWLAAPKRAKDATFQATLEIPVTQARDVLALLGRRDVTAGTIEATVQLGGVLKAPTAKASMTVRGVRVRPVRGREAPTLDILNVAGEWRNNRGQVTITARESSGKGAVSELLITAAGDPAQLGGVTGTFRLSQFDLAPIAPFLPGPLGGLSGRVKADLNIQGVDLIAGKVTGSMEVADGRLWLPSLGQIRRANAKIKFTGRGAEANVEARLGPGTITLEARTEDLDTKPVVTKLALRGVVPRGGGYEPNLVADITGTFQRRGLSWISDDLTIRNAEIVLPEKATQELLPETPPLDIVYVDMGAPPVPPKKPGAKRPPPIAPWLVAKVTLRRTTIKGERIEEGIVEELNAQVSGEVTIKVGKTVGLDGVITLQDARVAVFGHRYRLDRGSVRFLGTTDPLLDIHLFHEFSDGTTLKLGLVGSVSEKLDVLKLSSDPAIYTPEQLQAFLVGGSPGGEAGQQSSEAAASATASVLSSKIGRRLERVLPLGLKPSCAPGSGIESATCTLGTWRLDGRLYLGYRYRLEKVPNENTNEGLVEYMLSRRWRLEGTGGDLPSLNGDLIFRTRW